MAHNMDMGAEFRRLLDDLHKGNRAALDEMMPEVYSELRRLAEGYMQRERPQHTLQPTALVNEAYLRLVDVENMRWQDRAHFFAVSAQMMRRILVDAARARGCSKRGGGAEHLKLNESIDGMPDRGDDLVALDEAAVVGGEQETDLVGLDNAMNELARIDPRKVQVVEMRFFGGLSVDETAAVLGISGPSVLRDWKLARAWLMRELAG